MTSAVGKNNTRGNNKYLTNLVLCMYILKKYSLIYVHSQKIYFLKRLKLFDLAVIYVRNKE
jgi:hypothetical protein